MYVANNPQAPDPLLGATIAGRYVIRSRLGQGAHGRVYLADQRGTERVVALKLLQPTQDLAPKSRERFEREARLAARLSHPGLVTIFDSGLGTITRQDGVSAGERYFIAMERLAGESLGARLARGPLPAAQVRALAEQILAALQEAHGAGVIHRDLKPENIFLVPGADGIERVKVLDFGVAKDQSGPSTPLTTDGVSYGTIEYMSPEQIRGDTVDGRADLYALGVILYEALCGERPFSGSRNVEIASQHLSAAPPALQGRMPGLRDHGLAGVIGRALVKDPRKRFASAAEMRAALSQSGPDRSWYALGGAALVLVIAALVRLLSGGEASAQRVGGPVTLREVSLTGARVDGLPAAPAAVQLAGRTLQLVLEPGLNLLVAPELP